MVQIGDRFPVVLKHNIGGNGGIRSPPMSRIMPGRHSVSPDLLTEAADPVMDQLGWVLKRLTGVLVTHLKPPAYHGESEVTWFVQLFKDVAEENGWTERKAFLHLRSTLLGPAKA